MIKNPSEQATTIRNMEALLASDMWSLDRVLTYCIYDNSFVVQDDIIINNYHDYFEQFLEEIEVDQKYFYHPQMFAQDFYGTPDLDFLILYFANMTTNFEFIKPKIKVLRYDKLREINQLLVKYKSIISVNKENPPTYTFKNTQ